MVNHGWPLLTMVNHGEPLLTMVHHGYPWLSMVNRGSLWLKMDRHLLSVLIRELIGSQHLWNDILLDLITNYDRHTITGALARGETHPPYPSWGVGEDVLICLCLASRKLQCFHTETGKRRNSTKTKNDMVPMIVVLYSSCDMIFPWTSAIFTMCFPLSL